MVSLDREVAADAAQEAFLAFPSTLPSPQLQPYARRARPPVFLAGRPGGDGRVATPGRPRRATNKRVPFLFSAAESQRLLEACRQLPDRSRDPLRGPTYELIFALLYGLGLRVGEVSRLCGEDVERDRGLLIIRHTKFQKGRLVPFGPRMAARLSAFRSLREERFGPRAPALSLFSFGRDRAVHPGPISQTLHHLVPVLGLTVPPESRPCGCLNCAPPSPFPVSCAGTERESTRPNASSFSPPSWGT